MFVLRSVNEHDLSSLLKLSQLVIFINLPPDEEIIRSKIKSSLRSFKNPSADFSENYYLFVIEDLTRGEVVGASMIHGQHGTEEEPHFYLKVDKEQKFSQTINTGFVHGTLRLGLETDGPSEIGGLIVHPDYRGHKEKIGKQIAFVRFLFMSLFPERFKPTIHSELMPPLDKDGNSPLWEAIGRRFMNMDYHEADKLSRSNKEFILSLFPSENIYQTLLPLEARDAIGKVGKDTEPIRKMLESVGFKYIFEVDPFDGGPHYRCPLKDIKPIKNKKTGQLAFGKGIKGSEFLIEIPHPDHDFFAVKVPLEIGPHQLIMDEKLKDSLPFLKAGIQLTAIPF
jgi:arginine N-succinyltransferase